MLNILGLFDELGDKFFTMLILQTVSSFFQACIDENIEPSVTALTNYIKEKTGKEVSNEFLEKFLNIFMGNFNIFIMFAINEASEKISEDMLDTPSNIKEIVKRVF